MSRAPAASAATVLVVDSEPVFADGLRLLLSGAPGLRCVGTVDRARDILPACARAHPDLVLLDALLDPATYMIGNLKRLPRPPLVVVLLTERQMTSGYLTRALAAGGDLLVPRAVPGSDLLGGLERVQRQSPVLHPALGAYAAAAGRSQPLQPVLTSRQFEVLCLMADGKANDMIAEELFVAAETIRTHVKGIRHALKANSRAHAVSRAFQLGLLPVERLTEDPVPHPVA